MITTSYMSRCRIEPDAPQEQAQILLQEMQHRIANSLQIVASILLAKAKSVDSLEARMHLHDAHERIMSVADVQRQLCTKDHADLIEITPYLTRLCARLSVLTRGEIKISLKPTANAALVSSKEVEIIGLVVTELVINAVKHAFSDHKRVGEIVISYENSGAYWNLSVSDNGRWSPKTRSENLSSGLGKGLVTSLIGQLDAWATITSNARGTTVCITNEERKLRLPRVAWNSDVAFRNRGWQPPPRQGRLET